jgi:hypothetical protein
VRLPEGARPARTHGSKDLQRGRGCGNVHTGSGRLRLIGTWRLTIATRRPSKQLRAQQQSRPPRKGGRNNKASSRELRSLNPPGVLREASLPAGAFAAVRARGASVRIESMDTLN